MRRLLASTVGGVVAVVPASAGVAATGAGEGANENRDPLRVAGQALRPLERLAYAGDAETALEQAREEARRKRASDRRRAREDGGPAARRRRAPAPPSGGSGGSVASPALQSIANCESGGNPRAVGGGGRYRGKYQFTYSTWASVGGTGDPAAASEAEQDRRAAMLYSRAGSSPWPVCGG